MPAVHCLRCGWGREMVCERSVCPCDCHEPKEQKEAREKDRIGRQALRRGLRHRQKLGEDDIGPLSHWNHD